MAVNEDFNYAFVLSRQWMWIAGVWPDPYISSINSTRQWSLRFIMCLCLILYLNIPQIINVIRVWGNLISVIETISVANFSFLTLCKFIATKYYDETLRAMLTSIMNDWMTAKNNWKRNAMLKIAKRGRSLTLRCYICTIISAVFYTLFNMLKFYRSWPLQSKRMLIYSFTYPYNYRKSPNYEITFFIQFCAGIFTAFMNCTIDCFISQLLLHICAQLINLRIVLNNLIDNLANKSISSSEYKKDLSMIIIRHEDLIRSIKMVNNCYSAVLFVNMLAITFQLCFQTFQVYMKISNKNTEVPVFRLIFLIFYAIMVLTQFYAYCYSAERLITESTSVAHGVYESRWYDISPKDAKNLLFIIYRSTIPLRLNAGKFAIFSMQMFGTMVRTSMGYVSVLLTIKN